MTDRSATLLALASEVEAGEGPDRELDARIAMAVGADLAIGDWIAPDTYEAVAGTYTASVDAAIALLREALPGWSYHLQQSFSGRAAARLYDPDEDYDEELPMPSFPARGDAHTLPRAIVAAVLRAVAGEG